MTDLSKLSPAVQCFVPTSGMIYLAAGEEADAKLRAELSRLSAVEAERDHWHEYADDYRESLGDAVLAKAKDALRAAMMEDWSDGPEIVAKETLRQCEKVLGK